MKPRTIRRFSLTQILLHWANAFFYITLFVTGGLMLLKRIFEIEYCSYEYLSLLHRISGILLISFFGFIAVLSISIKGFRKSWVSLRQFFTWKLSDIAWLIKVPFNMLFRHVLLPPAGRFNPGQKLHVIAVFIVLTGVSISGTVMMKSPAILIAWVVHLGCFLLASVFLLLHMFLSLINPSTRKSLPAIFTGFVSDQYARKHHPLWTESKENQPHESYVSWKAAAITAIVLTGVISLLIYYYGAKKAQDDIHKLISKRGTSAILPGPLAKSHADDPNLKNCTRCHQSFLTPSPDACLSCHQLIARRMTQKSGFHGMMSNQCNDCHRDHLGEDADIRNFDTDQFDHNLANYKLQGKHSELPCQKCHLVKSDHHETERTKYIGIKFEKCGDCHNDPHLGKFKQACNVCHSEKGWKGADLLFSHNRDSRFKIDPVHSDIECAACHKGDQALLFRPLPTTCQQCHADIDNLTNGIASSITSEPDPHAGRVTCSQCHQTTKQKPAGYASKCKSCHNEQYEQLFYDWNKVFEKRQIQANRYILKLREKDLAGSSEISDMKKEADKTGFHNIDLANKLWDQIFIETSNRL